jgi:Zn-dependent protease
MTDAAAAGWPGMLLLLALLALIGIRAPVNARGRVRIAAPIEHVFDLIDLKHEGEQHWHRAKVRAALIDPGSRTYRMSYAVEAGPGGPRLSTADFRVRERESPTRLILDRASLENRPHANELLAIEAELSPASGGTALRLSYIWGPRPLIAQLLARTDLYAALLRIKSLAETGKASTRAETFMSAGVAAVTGLVTLAGFGLWFGWISAVLIVIALAVHEFGHLLAFRLLGQPWGRLVFLPFLGALAMPRLPFRSDGEQAFAALMGPGFSVLAILPTVIAASAGWSVPEWIVQFAGLAALLNLFNLMPVEPLDGGVALRAMLRRFLGERTYLGMLVSSAVIALIGIRLGSPVVVVLGVFAALANMKPRPAPSSVPLSARELAAALSGFVVIGAVHVLGVAAFLAPVTSA